MPYSAFSAASVLKGSVFVCGALTERGPFRYPEEDFGKWLQTRVLVSVFRVDLLCSLLRPIAAGSHSGPPLPATPRPFRL